jgi:hypothetical protein
MGVCAHRFPGTYDIDDGLNSRMHGDSSFRCDHSGRLF